jgi:hypothetical protein
MRRMRDYGWDCCWRVKRNCKIFLYFSEYRDVNVYMYFGMVLCIEDDEEL